MAVDRFLSTAPGYYRPETREGRNRTIVGVAGSRFGGSRFGVARGNRVKELRISGLPGFHPSLRTTRRGPANREPANRSHDILPPMSKDSTRRDFLWVAGGATAYAAHGTLPVIAAMDDVASAEQATTAAPGELMAGWFDRPMRWAQLTLVENDPGPLRSAVLARLLPRLHADAATLSAGGIVAYYPTEVPLHHRSAWLGDERSVRHAGRRLPRAGHARRRAHRSARGARRGARGASRLDRRRRATASRAGTGRIPSCGSPARSVPTTSSSWTRSIARSSRSTRSTASSPTAGRRRAATATACTARRTSRTRPGCDLPRTTDRRDPARRALRRVAQGAADRALEALGRDRACGQPRRALHPQRPAGSEDRRRARGDPVRRQPGAPRPDAAVDERPAREGIPLRDGPTADRRHLQRRPRGAVSLEGLRAERARDPALGRRGHRERHAPVGHEVLRRAVRPRAGCPSSSASTTGTTRTSAICATRRRSRAWRCCYSEQTARYHPGVADGRSRRRSRARHVSRARRGAHPVRAGARSAPHAGAARRRSSC